MGGRLTVSKLSARLSLKLKEIIERLDLVIVKKTPLD